MPYADLADELFRIMDPEKHRPPHQEMSMMMQGELAVMRLLDAAQGCLLAGDVSRKLNMTTSRIAAVLGSLEKKGLILRAADPADKRRVAVQITDEGRALNRRKREEVLSHMQQMLRRLGEQDAREYVRLTRRVFELMHEDERNIP